MSNIVETIGWPRLDRYVRDMEPGDVGYTAPWLIEDDNLEEDAILMTKGGTASVRVECVEPHRYSITYETPEYRSLQVETETLIDRLIRWTTGSSANS